MLEIVKLQMIKVYYICSLTEKADKETNKLREKSDLVQIDNNNNYVIHCQIFLRAMK